MDEIFTIDAARPHEYELARAFYLECGYGGGIRDADWVLLARVGSVLAGVVRLADEEGATILRGMQVHPLHQGKGIGRALLRACLPRMEKVITYCLPYAHLPHFYAEAGFELLEPPGMPAFLAERLAGYRAQGMQVVAMRRLPGAYAPAA